MSLDLHGNRLAGLAPESFKELTGLRSLDLSENELVTLPAGLLAPMCRTLTEVCGIRTCEIFSLFLILGDSFSCVISRPMVCHLCLSRPIAFLWHRMLRVAYLGGKGKEDRLALIRTSTRPPLPLKAFFAPHGVWSY